MIDTRTAGWGVLILRLTLGALFLAHAGLKIFVFTPAGTAAYFASLGLPGVVGYFDILLETLGGVALILGLFTRIAALLLIPVLLGAIILVHWNVGFFFNDANGGWEYPAFWAAALLVLALLGDGPMAARPMPRLAST
jgi:putative oxidoreductase